MLASPSQKHENSQTAQTNPSPLPSTPRKIGGYVAIQPKIRRGFSLDLSFSDPEDSPSPRAMKKKIRWTEAEDKLLIAGVKNFGLRWSKISKTIPGRGSHQCLKRWSLLVRKLGSAEILGNGEQVDSTRSPTPLTPTITRTNKRILDSSDVNTTPTPKRRLFTGSSVTPQTMRVERVLTKRHDDPIVPISPTSYKSAVELEKLLFQSGGLNTRDDSDIDEFSMPLPLCLKNIPKSVEENLIPISEIKSETCLPELCDLPSTPSSDEHPSIAANLLISHPVCNTPAITNTPTSNVYSQILNSSNKPLYLAVIQDLIDDFSVLTSRVNKLATKMVMSIMGQHEVWNAPESITMISSVTEPAATNDTSPDIGIDELGKILNQVNNIEPDSLLLNQQSMFIEELLQEEQSMELLLGKCLPSETRLSLDYSQFLDQLHNSRLPLSHLQSEDDSESTDQEFALRTRKLKKDKIEEFREDRGATISKHEVEELYKEDEEDGKLKETQIIEKAVPSEEDYAIFSPQQLHLLRKQQQQNLQILVQAFVLERELRGSDSEFGKHWQNKIHELKNLQSEARQSSPSEYVSFFEVVGLDYTDLLFKAPFSEEYRSKEFETAIRKPKSKRIKIDTRNGQPAWENRVQDPIPLPISVKSALDEFYPLLDFDLIPQIVPALPRVRVTFHPSEDSLLLIGLKSFGDDWNTIRSHMLPSKTPSQLENRFNNLKSRRYPDNPVKEYYLQQIKPLTVEEEEILRNSVKIYGKRFKLISEKFLIHRPAFVLKRAWQLLVPKNKKGASNGTIEDKVEEDEDGYATSTLEYPGIH